MAGSFGFYRVEKYPVHLRNLTADDGPGRN